MTNSYLSFSLLYHIFRPASILSETAKDVTRQSKSKLGQKICSHQLQAVVQWYHLIANLTVKEIFYVTLEQ